LGIFVSQDLFQVLNEQKKRVEEEEEEEEFSLQTKDNNQSPASQSVLHDKNVTTKLSSKLSTDATNL
jgi:hypothetical protein